DPRDYALIAFGGAGPLHANALARLLGSWPAIVPPGPGVLCALGDATTALRDECAKTFVRRFSQTSAPEIVAILQELATEASGRVQKENISSSDMRTTFQVDVRYHGQGLRLTVEIGPQELQRDGLRKIAERFDQEHKRLFTFALPLEHEIVTLRAAVQGRSVTVERPSIPRGGAS